MQLYRCCIDACDFVISPAEPDRPPEDRKSTVTPPLTACAHGSGAHGVVDGPLGWAGQAGWFRVGQPTTRGVPSRGAAIACKIKCRCDDFVLDLF